MSRFVIYPHAPWCVLASRVSLLLFLTGILVLPGALRAQDSQDPDDLRANWRAVVDKHAAEIKSLESQETELLAETGQLEATHHKLVEDAAKKTVVSFIVDFVYGVIPLGKYLIFPPLVMMLILLIWRPSSLLAYFKLSRIPHAFKVPDGELAVNAKLKIALLIAVGLFLLLNGGLAFAQEKVERPAYKSSAREVVEFLKGDASKKLHIRLKRLVGHKDARVRVNGRDGVPANLPAPGRVQNGSFYHYVLLAAFELEAGNTATGSSMLQKALENLPRKDREFRIWLIQLVRYVFGMASPIAEREPLKELSLRHLSDVMSLVELGKAVESKDAEFAAQLLERANDKAKDPSELLLVFHYRKASGLIENPDEEWAALLEKVQNTRQAEIVFKVFLSAKYLKMEDMASSAMDRLVALKLGRRDLFKYGQELVLAGHAPQGVSLFEALIQKSKRSSHLHELIAFASARSMSTLRDKAFFAALEHASSYDAAYALLKIARAEQLDLTKAFTKALSGATRLSQVEQLIEFADRMNLKDLADLARAESVGLMRHFDDMVEHLKKAIEAKSMDVAARIAHKINEKHERKSVPLDLLPKSQFVIPFYKGKVQMGVVAATLLFITGKQTQGLTAIEHLVSKNFDGIILGLEDMQRYWDALLFVNALDIYQQMLAAQGYEEARQAVNEVESWALVQAGLTLPLPPGAEERLSEVKNQHARLKARVESLQHRKATLISGIKEAGDELARAHARLAAHILYVITLFCLVLLATWIAIIGGLQSAAAVKRYRTFAFFARFFEIIGWLQCTTIVLIPVGIASILCGQAMGIFGTRHDNYAPSALDNP